MTERHPLTLRSRLLAGVTVVAVVFIGVSVSITLATRDELIDQVDTRLKSMPAVRRDLPDFRGQDADSTGSSVPEGSGGGDSEFATLDDGEQVLPPVGPGQERFSNTFEGVVDADGNLTVRYVPNIGDDYSAPIIDVDKLPTDKSEIFTADSENGKHTYRVLADPLGSSTLIVAIPLDDVDSTIRNLIVVEVLGSIAILFALGLVSWWVIRLGIRPVKEMTVTAREIADGDLEVRIPQGAPGTESGDLAAALNRMLSTINHAIDEQAASEARLRRFVADASHELRTPLTTIRGYAELYRHGGLGAAESLDDAMRRTEQESARMGRLVEDMLLLAKLDEERPLALRSVDLAGLVRDTAVDTQVANPDREIVVEIGDEPLMVNGDEDRLRQVLANLVGNALAHTEPSTRIELAVRSVDDVVEVSVVDLGPGMSPEVVGRATERFFRADPARSRHRGGSGLGLSIVDSIVRAHGGTVTLSSEVGVGTTVRFAIPVDGGGATTAE